MTNELKKTQKSYEEAIRNDEAVRASSRMYAVIGSRPHDWLKTATGREIADALILAALERK